MNMLIIVKCKNNINYSRLILDWNRCPYWFSCTGWL